MTEMPSRLLIVSDYADGAGGAEIMVRSIRDEMRARGVDARIFATGLRDAEGRNFADYTCFGTRSSARTALQSANPAAARSLARVIREFDPQIVHVRMFLTQLSPLILPLLRDRRVLYHLAWYRAICPKGTKQLPDGSACTFAWGEACLRERCVPLRDWLPLELQRRLLQRDLSVFDRIVANSQHMQERYVREGIESVVIYNGVAAARTVAPPSKVPTVVYAGRLTREKGVSILLDAFARLRSDAPNLRLLIAGDGPERPSLEAQARSLSMAECVTFLGKQSRSAMERLWSSATVAVVPSTWEEPFGIVAAEAMMHGLPVIASRIGGLAEIVVDGETGYTFAPGDAEALAGALRACLADPARAEKMGAAGLERAMRMFSIDACVDSFAQLYADMLSASARKEQEQTHFADQ